jgi:coatomer subunit beta'
MLVYFKVSWSPSGNLVAVASADSFYVLRFSRDEYINFVDNGGELGDEGVEDAFELIAEVNESVRTGKWLEDCFIYTTANNRLNYLVGTMTNTISHFDT